VPNRVCRQNVADRHATRHQRGDRRLAGARRSAQQNDKEAAALDEVESEAEAHDRAQCAEMVDIEGGAGEAMELEASKDDGARVGARVGGEYGADGAIEENAEVLERA